MIHKSATEIGTVEFKNGNRNTLYLGHNRSTGERIVWQQVAGRRSQRVTGRNIGKFAEELNHVLNEGEAKWIGGVNDAALNVLREAMS
jgi:hypothetical protein